MRSVDRANLTLDMYRVVLDDRLDPIDYYSVLAKRLSPRAIAPHFDCAAPEPDEGQGRRWASLDCSSSIILLFAIARPKQTRWISAKQTSMLRVSVRQISVKQCLSMPI